MSTPSLRTRLMLSALVCSALVLACLGDRDPTGPSTRRDQPAAIPQGRVRALVSSETAAPGSHIAFALEGETTNGERLVALQGWLSYDAAKLRYIGQRVDTLTIVAVNDSGAARGRLHVLAANGRSVVADSAQLVFEVLQSGYASSLRFVLSSGALPNGTEVTAPPVGALARATLALPAQARRLTLADWAPVPGNRKALGTPTVYGDVNGNGAINAGDVTLVSNWAVGNGTPPDTIAFNVGNVAPGNLPGTGGPDDDDPPGWGASPGCARGLNAGDVGLISNYAVGNPVPIVGETLPAEWHRPVRCGGVPSVMPDSIVWPASPQPFVQSTANPDFSYYRTIFAIGFVPGTTASAKEAILVGRQALVIGAMGKGTGTEIYVIQVPDVGPMFADVETFVSSFAQQPAVSLVMKMSARENYSIRGRYPIDGGVTSSRAGWSSPTNVAIRPYLAIRSPLAWGCENGLYDSPPLRVGMFDTFFDNVPQDLSASASASSVFPPSTDASQSIPISAAVGGQLNHAYSVAGIIAARGDNGIGMPGTIWRVPLDVYPIATQQRETMNGLAFLDESLRRAAERGVRVMNLSVAVGEASDTTQVKVARQFLRRFITQGDRLIVVASGDSSLTRSREVLASSTDKGIRAVDRALAQLADTLELRERILFVTGSLPNTGARRPESNVWTGVASIAAPADSIAALNATGALLLRFGTSFAAGYVTGVVAQLWTMDPSLSATQVADYVLRGASSPGVPKRSPITGAVLPASHIGVSGVYQLDAYGSLTLLSRERPGTPICGLEVTLERDTQGRATQIRIARELSSDVLPLPLTATGGSPYRGTFSVAQGGRLIAIDSAWENSAATLRRLSNGSWQADGAIPGIDRVVFAERDTIYMRTLLTQTGSGLFIVLRQDLFVRVGSDTSVRNVPERMVTTGLPDGAFSAGWGSGSAPVAPDGDQLYFRWGYSGVTSRCSGPDDPSQDGEATSYIVRLRGSPTNLVTLQSREVDICRPPNAPNPGHEFESDDVVWNPIGNEFILLTHLTTLGSGTGNEAERFQRYESSSAGITPLGSSAQADATRITWAAWSPTGDFLRTQEQPTAVGACYLRSRALGSLTATFGTDVVLPGYCRGTETPVSLPTLRASRRR